MGNAQQTNRQQESWLRRVAILLSSLPASTASELVQSLDDDAQDRVQDAVATLTNVDRTERDSILHEFRSQMFANPVVPKTSTPAEEFEDEFEIRQSSDSKSGPSQSASLLNRQVASVVSQWELPRSFAATSPGENGFAFLDEVDDDTMVQLLSCEHPQTIALVFASITPKQAARVLPRLDAEVQSETVRRIGRLDNVPAATTDEVAAQLQRRVQELQSGHFNSGQNALQAIIEAMPEALEDERASVLMSNDYDHLAAITTDPLADLASNPFEPSSGDETIPIDRDPTAASREEIQQYLLQLPRTELCVALGKVQTRDALLTLCGLPNEAAEQALSILPRAQAKQVRRDMTNFGPLQLREIDQAQTRVARAAQEMPNHSITPVAA